MDSVLTQNISERDAARIGSRHTGYEGHLRAVYGSRGPTSRGPSTLVQRNIAVGSHRTTVRLEPAMWDALGEICH